jgi:hypothetical protein
MLESSYICRMHLLCPGIPLQSLKSAACYHGCGTGNIPAADGQVPSGHKSLNNVKPVPSEQKSLHKEPFSRRWAVLHLSGDEAASFRRPT